MTNILITAWPVKWIFVDDATSLFITPDKLALTIGFVLPGHTII